MLESCSAPVNSLTQLLGRHQVTPKEYNEYIQGYAMLGELADMDRELGLTNLETVDTHNEFQALFEDEEFLTELTGVKPNTYFSSNEYISLSRKEKQAELWKAIHSAEGTSNTFPGLDETAKIFLADNSITFTTAGDAMKTYNWGMQ